MLESTIRFLVNELLPVLPVWITTMIQYSIGTYLIAWFLAKAFNQVAWAEVRKLWREYSPFFRYHAQRAGEHLRNGIADPIEYPHMRIVACVMRLIVNIAVVINLLLYFIILFYFYVAVGLTPGLLPPLWLALTLLVLTYLLLFYKAETGRTVLCLRELIAQNRQRRQATI